MKEKGFSDYSDSDSEIWHFSIFLGLGFAKIDCQITFSQVAAVVYSDYILLLRFDPNSWKTAVTHPREG